MMPKCDLGSVFAFLPASMVISGGYWLDFFTGGFQYSVNMDGRLSPSRICRVCNTHVYTPPLLNGVCRDSKVSAEILILMYIVHPPGPKGVCRDSDTHVYCLPTWAQPCLPSFSYPGVYPGIHPTHLGPTVSDEHLIPMYMTHPSGPSRIYQDSNTHVCDPPIWAQSYLPSFSYPCIYPTHLGPVVFTRAQHTTTRPIRVCRNPCLYHMLGPYVYTDVYIICYMAGPDVNSG